VTDVEAVVRAFLAGQAGVVALTAERIWADVDLPPDYRPSCGAALLFSRRGGPLSFSRKVLVPSLQFRSYGVDDVQSRALDQALFESLDDVQAGLIKRARLDVQGQLIKDPRTGWYNVLSFYTLWIGNP
jgi:hypothetical protein